MCIRDSKREMMFNLFISNFTDNHQFKPVLFIPGETDPLKVIQETKLLGYWLTSDMKPRKHVDYIISRAIKKMWTIRRLKSAKCNNTDLVNIFILLIRSILETDCPVFHSQLTDEETADIERVQKIFTKIVLGGKYSNYEDACKVLNLTLLKTRREDLCLKFALKCLKNENLSSMFV